jgi:hypothetical protein
MYIKFVKCCQNSALKTALKKSKVLFYIDSTKNRTKFAMLPKNMIDFVKGINVFLYVT